MTSYDLIAAIDLGSNSFRLQVARVVGDQIYPLDGIKESVRLAAGLSSDRYLDDAAQERGINALLRFAERLRGFEPGAVRCVATNTLRVAKNAAEFLVKAEAALGFPIEVIAGREEARLIYVGVAHTLPNPERQQLVVDIGGGSTEFIIGRSFESLQLESLYMGCVSYSLRFFPNGAIDKRSMKEAMLAARQEIQVIAQAYKQTGWERAVGSSGSAKALVEVLQASGQSDGKITREGLAWMREAFIAAGSVARLTLPGIRSERLPVLPGGLAIMSAVFEELGLEEMVFSDGALRLGVLYDLLGRYHHDDLRDATVDGFVRRYGVDQGQAWRVRHTAVTFLEQLRPEARDPDDMERRFLEWAAMLHEIGISVAHSSYHKHSAYILANADMPGFSRMDQGRLARMVLAHRGKLERLQGVEPGSTDWALIACLRLAVLFNRARVDSEGSNSLHEVALPPVEMALERKTLVLTIDQEWLQELPLTVAALQEEARQWAACGRELLIR